MPSPRFSRKKNDLFFIQYGTVLVATVPGSSEMFDGSTYFGTRTIYELEPSGPEARARVFVHVLYEFRDY